MIHTYNTDFFGLSFELNTLNIFFSIKNSNSAGIQMFNYFDACIHTILIIIVEITDEFE